VENRRRGALIGAMTAIMLVMFWGSGTQTPRAQTPAPGGRGAGGRGPAGPPEPTPRLADGTPNLGRVPGERGVWNVPYITNMGERVISPEGTTVAETRAAVSRGGRGGRVAGPADAPLGGGEGTGAGGRGGAKSEPQVPFQIWAAGIYDYNSRNQSKYDPEGYCLPPGGPRLMATPYPMEIIQLPEQKRIIMIFEGATHVWREIYMDDRPHPTGDALNPTYLGHSVGHWEGDTLVVDIVGFNEQTWLDYFGHPHTDMLHVVERYSRPNKRTLHYEAVIDDPGAYTRSFNIRWDIPWNATGELSEYICQENNKYLQRLTDDVGEPIFGGKK
jgi:hypothetical protein